MWENILGVIIGGAIGIISAIITNRHSLRIIERKRAYDLEDHIRNRKLEVINSQIDSNKSLLMLRKKELTAARLALSRKPSDNIVKKANEVMYEVRFGEISQQIFYTFNELELDKKIHVFENQWGLLMKELEKFISSEIGFDEVLSNIYSCTKLINELLQELESFRYYSVERVL